ncbi:MAG: hypothetical protein E6H58_18485 [Betaproteobacteria bacterium]|nr:MAG: hypothetical protein E6H58_18485 [Betaproteobacteria bacterium]
MTSGAALAAGNDDAVGAKALAEARKLGIAHPILDTHIHFYQPSRPGGVPWPPVGSALYRDVLPPEYKALAMANGILASGIVEASPLVSDNQWILDLVRGDHFFPWFAGQLEIGSADFGANLAHFAKDARFIGIRGFLWSPPAITLDAAQLRDLRDLASRGVEASPLVSDNQWILDLVRGDHFFPWFAGQLEIGSADFGANLAHFAKDARFIGIRGFLWSPPAITLDAAQLRDLRDLASRGMTLDIISRGTTNTKDRVEALCTTVPDLRIIIDHLGGAQGAVPAPEWELAIRRLADVCPNLYMKFSSFYDMYQVGDGNRPWTAPTDLAAYKAHFDVLLSAFGEDRLIWGSNWPVSDLGGSFSGQIRLAEEYLAPFGQHVRDKVMFLNGLKFYRRVPPTH